MTHCAQWARRLLPIMLLAFGLQAAAVRAQQSPAVPPDHAAQAESDQAAPLPDQAESLALHNRKIVDFRATRAGVTPAERAEAARLALDAVLAAKGPGTVSRTAEGDSFLLHVDGTPIFFLVTEDLAGPRTPAALEVFARQVEVRLATAMHEAREMTDPKLLAIGAAYAAAATVLAYVLLRVLFALRRRVLASLTHKLRQMRDAEAATVLVSTYVDHARTAARLLAAVVSWGLALLIVDLWVTFVLRQFAYTRPWGEQSTRWLLDVLKNLAVSSAGAVPGLLTAVLIFVLARLVTRANSLFMERVEGGGLQFGWLDRDTAGPTRRLGNAVIWLFAVAMAYPYLPGANSEAFKGVTVLAGLMISLGASGVVGQAMSGFSLMYSRALRVGEYVKIGETEGTVTQLGMFATKVHTGMGEEVSVPNAVVFSQPVRNFSRLVQDGQFVLHTAVTIGYSTPWRQVHAMLLEAARRSPGVADSPPPYVVQTALSDFYVEYRLCAQGNRSAPRRRAQAMNELHANIQDVFNENGVQIMSPHYMADTPQPQIVPPGQWDPGLAKSFPDAPESDRPA